MIQNVWIFLANLWIHQWQLLGESFSHPILKKQEQEKEVRRYSLHKVDVHGWLLACYGKHSWVSSPSHMYLFVGTQFWDFSYLSNLTFLFLVHHILILTHIVLYLYLYTLTFIWILSTNQHSWYFQWRIYVFSFSFPQRLIKWKLVKWNFNCEIWKRESNHFETSWNDCWQELLIAPH